MNQNENASNVLYEVREVAYELRPEKTCLVRCHTTENDLWVNMKNNFIVVLCNTRYLFVHAKPFQRNRVCPPVPSGYLTLPTVTAL